MYINAFVLSQYLLQHYALAVTCNDPDIAVVYPHYDAQRSMISGSKKGCGTAPVLICTGSVSIRSILLNLVTGIDAGGLSCACMHAGWHTHII